VNLVEQALNWPTTTTTDSCGRGYQMSAGKAFIALPGAVGAASIPDSLKNWPSPQANDEKNLGAATPGHSPQLMHEPGLLVQATLKSPGKRRGSLNGRWVLQLMGFPEDWCALPEESVKFLFERKTKRFSGPLEMPSCLR
jgi:hypothetical protein